MKTSESVGSKKLPQYILEFKIENARDKANVLCQFIIQLMEYYLYHFDNAKTMNIQDVSLLIKTIF